MENERFSESYTIHDPGKARRRLKRIWVEPRQLFEILKD
jgi:hypothetical protein